jgi:hypothetical protein
MRKSGAINEADFKRDIRNVREFKDALITEVSFPACDGASKDPAYMTIKFEPEKVKLKKDTGKAGNPPAANQKRWLPANFRLKIDGIDCSKVRKIGALTINQQSLNSGMNSGLNSGLNSSDCSQTAKAILGSDEYRTKLIGDLYQKYLHRPADQPGINAFIGLLKSGGTTEKVVINIISSPEYFTAQAGGTNSGFVGKIYQDLLGRPADASSSAFINALNNSSQTRTQVATGMVGSPEYLTRVVQNIYQTYLGRTPSPAESSQWLSILQGGKGSEFMLANILGSQEYRTKIPSGDCAGVLSQQLLGHPAGNVIQRNPFFSEIVITIPKEDAQPFSAWYETQKSDGEIGGRRGKLEYLDINGNVVVELDLEHVKLKKLVEERAKINGILDKILEKYALEADIQKLR